MQPTIIIDFTNVEDTNTIPDGVYPGIVMDAEYSENSAKDGYNLVWHLTISAGEYEGRQMRFWTSFKKTVWFRMKAALKAAGIDASGPVQFELDETNHIVSPELVGKPVAIVVVNQAGDDKIVRSNVAELRPITDLEISKPSVGNDPLMAQLRGDKPVEKKGGLKLK